MVHPSTTLTLSAGQTVGIVITCNGDLHQEFGSITTPIIKQNSALYLMNGFSGTGYSGTFNMPYNLAVFNGSIIYSLNISGYSRSPASGLSSTTVASPTCSPSVSNTYTVTASNGFGCTATSSLMIYANNLPLIQSVTASAQPVCLGSSTQLNVNSTTIEDDQLSTSITNNGAITGTAFDVTAVKAITMSSLGILTDNSTYTVSVTDGNGCTASSTYEAFVRFIPQVIVAASPAAVCSGATTQMMINNGATDADYIQIPATGNATTNGGVVFNITTTRSIILQGVKLHIQTVGSLV